MEHEDGMDDLAPDLGLRYLEAGHASSRFAFMNANFLMLSRTAATNYSSTMNLNMEVAYAVTFDFDISVYRQLLKFVGPAARARLDLAFGGPFREPSIVEFSVGEIAVDFHARLGVPVRIENERFVPFMVEQFTTADGGLFSIEIEEQPKSMQVAQGSRLVLEIEAAPVLSLAMVENNIPLVARLSLTNSGPEPLHELIVELALLPDFSQKWTSHVSSIPAGGTFRVEDIELPLDRTKLVNQLERSSATLMLWVRQNDVATPLATASKPIDVLAYNEWTRSTVPHVLAAFVLPNHPAVAQLLAETRAPLERLTRNPALDGYQSKSPDRVAAVAQAIYETIQGRGITYSNPPASFERAGQKVSLIRFGGHLLRGGYDAEHGREEGASTT